MNIQDFTTDELLAEIERRKKEPRHTIFNPNDKDYFCEGVVENIREHGKGHREWEYHVYLGDESAKRAGFDFSRGEAFRHRTKVYLKHGVFTKKNAPKIGDTVRMYAKMTDYESGQAMYGWAIHRVQIVEILKHKS